MAYGNVKDLPTFPDKIFETIFSFDVKQGIKGKAQCLFARIDKIEILGI